MSMRRRAVFVALLIGVPVLFWSLCAASGWEMFTKRFKLVEVEVADELFGDTILEAHEIPGPIFGYYIGRDIAGATTGVAVIVGIGAWCWRRRSARRRPR